MNKMMNYMNTKTTMKMNNNKNKKNTRHVNKKKGIIIRRRI